jgi:hypothetical protein
MMTFRSRASEDFWALYNRMPRSAQRAADKQFELFRKDPTSFPALEASRRVVERSHQRCISGARINDAYRALAVREGDVFYWFWIGPHDQYERLIKT